MNGWALRLPTPGGTRPSFIASDRGQKHFFASKIVLRVIVRCLCGVSSMSSSRRIPRFIVLFSSGYRSLFFRVASLWAYVVFASFLRIRVVGSSFRWLRYILGRYLMYGDIYCTDFTCISYAFPFLLCTLLLCYPVTLLPCYSVTLLFRYLVTMLPCYSETRSVTKLLLYRLYLHKLYLPFFAWYLVALLPCYLVTLLPSQYHTRLKFNCFFFKSHLICYRDNLWKSHNTTKLSVTNILSSVLNWILDHYKPVSSIYHFSVQNFLVISRGQLYKAWRQT